MKTRHTRHTRPTARMEDHREQSEASLTSFAHLPSKRERIAKSAAQELIIFCETYPAYAYLVEEKIELILGDAKSDSRSDRDLVYAALETGCTSVAEIRDEIGQAISIARIHRALAAMTDHVPALVEIRETGRREGSSHNKQLRYFLVQNSPFNR
jgi:hypothetical protein